MRFDTCSCKWKWLTFRTVVAGPTRSADDLAGWWAAVVAEGIVSRSAEDFTAGAVVEGCAVDSVGEPQVRPRAPVLVFFHPGASDVGYALFRHAGY